MRKTQSKKNSSLSCSRNFIAISFALARLILDTKVVCNTGIFKFCRKMLCKVTPLLNPFES